MHVNFCKIKFFWYSIAYTRVAVSEAQGHAGGIWILSSISFVAFQPWISLGNVLPFRFLWEAAPGSYRQSMPRPFLEFNFSFGII